MNYCRLRALHIMLATTLSVAIVSCADEEKSDNSSKGQNNLNKSEKVDFVDRPYYQYESKNYSNDEVNKMLSEFDKVLNSDAILPDMSIEDALFVMETYFNYGVADHSNQIGTEGNDQARKFSFSVPLVNGQVSGAELKQRYFDFVVEALIAIRGKVISVSDLYVSELSENVVRFTLDINPTLSKNYKIGRFYFPVFYRFGEDVPVPTDLVSNWEEWTPNFRDVHKEENVYKVTQKLIPVSNFHRMYYAQIITPCFGVLAQGNIHKANVEYDPAVFNYLGIKDPLVHNTLERLENFLTDYGAGRVIVDYYPEVFNGYGYMVGDVGFNARVLNLYRQEDMLTPDIVTTPITMGYLRVEALPELFYRAALTHVDRILGNVCL